MRCALLLAGLLATTLAACGRDDPAPARTATPTSPTPRNQSPPRQPAEAPFDAQALLRERGWIEFTMADPRAFERGPLELSIGGPGLELLNHGFDGVLPPSDHSRLVRPGSYCVELRSPGFSSARDERWWLRHIEVRAGTTTRLVCDGIAPLRAVRARVVGPDGEPVASSAIRVHGRADFRFRRRSSGGTYSDAAGGFDVNLPDADYCWLSAHSDGFAWGFTRVDPRAASDVEIRLARGGTIEFHVADGGFVESSAWMKSPSDDLHIAVEVGPAGEFQSIDDVPAGRWTIRFAVFHASSKWRDMTVDVRDGEKTVLKLDAE